MSMTRIFNRDLGGDWKWDGFCNWICSKTGRVISRQKDKNGKNKYFLRSKSKQKIIEPYQRKSQFRNSLKRCLVILGADPSEVYQTRLPGIYGNRRSKEKIRERYDKRELLDWGQYLYKQAIRSAHPDRGGNAEEAIAINRAFQTLQHICGVK